MINVYLLLDFGQSGMNKMDQYALFQSINLKLYKFIIL